MKYLITERQYNIIKESIPGVKSFQRMIDGIVDQLREKCDGVYMQEDDFLCEILDTIDTIKVDNIVINKDTGNNHIYIIFNYYSHSQPDVSEFYYSYIAPELKKFFGSPFFLRYKANQLIKPY